jgi:sorbitol-specific phosphotransferase system component IIA
MTRPLITLSLGLGALSLLVSCRLLSKDDEGRNDRADDTAVEDNTDDTDDTDEGEPERVCEETEDLCASGECVYDINVPIAELDLNVTYDGGKVPSASSGDDVLVLFTETTTGDTQTYGFDGAEDSVQVPFGTYDIALQLGAAEPRPNSLTTVRRGVSVSGDAGLNLDLPVGELKLKVTYDGGKVPSASSGDDVLVLFTETTTGETQTYSFDGDVESVEVPHGTYDIALQLGAAEPRPNSLTTVRRGVEVSGDGGLDLNLPVGELKLKVTYDGGKVPSASSGDDVLVLFTETSTGETQTYSFDGDVESVEVPHGTYDIALQFGAAEPRPNSLATVRRDVEVSGDGGLDLNLQVGEQKLKVTYDGGKVPSASSGDDVLVLFTETSTGETQSYSFDGDQDTVEVPFGTYDIALQFGAADPRANSLATVRSGVEVSGDGGLDLNMSVGDLSLTVTYDGGKVPSAPSGDDVYVLFTETTTRETQSVSFDGAEDSIQVPLGTYDIALQFGAADPRANSLATVRRGVEVTGDAGLNLDLQVEEVNGLVTYDGGKVPSASSGDDLLVRFVEITTGESQSISTDGDDYTIQLPSGIYDVQLQLGASEPRPNSLTTVGICVEVP